MEHKKSVCHPTDTSLGSDAGCPASTDSAFDTPRSSVRPKMPLEQRAKQFLPFSALPGLDEALEAEAARHETV